MNTNKITSIHMLHGIFCFICITELHIGIPSAIVRMQSVHGKLYVLDNSICSENLLNMVLSDIQCETADVDACGARWRGALALLATWRPGKVKNHC